MPAVTTQKLLEKLNWRYAVKHFNPTRKINDSDWKALEQSLVLSPSSYGLQLWKFLVVQDMDVRKQLTPLTWNQKQVESCSHYVVFCHRTEVSEKDILDYVAKMSEVRETPVEKYQKFIEGAAKDLIHGPRSKWAKEWCARQTYIALGSFMTCAALLGIDTSPIEGLEPEKYDKVLGLEGTGYVTAMACGAGYRHPDDKYQNMKKVRFDTSRVVKYI